MWSPPEGDAAHPPGERSVSNDGSNLARTRPHRARAARLAGDQRSGEPAVRPLPPPPQSKRAPKKQRGTITAGLPSPSKKVGRLRFSVELMLFCELSIGKRLSRRRLRPRRRVSAHGIATNRRRPSPHLFDGSTIEGATGTAARFARDRSPASGRANTPRGVLRAGRDRCGVGLHAGGRFHNLLPAALAFQQDGVMQRGECAAGSLAVG